MSSVKHKKNYPERNRKVFIAMSGGVDSSVAALLLKNEGYRVTGVFMKCWSGSSSHDSLGIHSDVSIGATCAWERDAEDARRVAEKLGIPFYIFDFEEEYKRDVVNYMVEGYRAGITPNPDVMCNKHIKFGLFLNRARELGADFIATGHYVRLQSNRLQAAKDKNKDQSYFLWTLTQESLQYCLFPIGDYLKPEVRAIAKEAGLPTAEKKDSQGVCFMGAVTLDEFLKAYIPAQRGEVMTTAGKRIGAHKGAHFYTIGQRHGLDLKEKERALGRSGAQETQAHYVASKDVKTNTVTVAEGADNPALFRDVVELGNVNFIAEKPEVPARVFARVRYRQPLFESMLVRSGDSYALQFLSPQKFIAEGQSAVFYDAHGVMLGGGVIV